MASPTTEVYAGIDVSKGRLKVAVRPAAERFGVPNDDAGIEEFVGRLKERRPALVVLESTGGLERAP